MLRWTRTIPLDSPLSDSPRHRTEMWHWHSSDGSAGSFAVDVTLGKPFDVQRLKGCNRDEARRTSAFLRATAANLFGADAATRTVDQCPCCERATRDSQAVVAIHGAQYRRCRSCGHVFVSPQPSPQALAALFAQSEGHAAAYIDRNAAELRIEQIVAPKLEWVKEMYRRSRGRGARSVLDVGAGGGHFVEGCRRSGLQASGIEISDASRRFAHDAFGLSLRDCGLEEVAGSGAAVDLLTMWGLLEYVPSPLEMLRAAHRVLAPPQGMLIVEVPRFDCASTAAQSPKAAAVFRHLDPTSHVNCFSDSSIATALLTAGFQPVAAWYFGMDAYELMMQLGLAMNADAFAGTAGELLGPLQQCLDSALACDDLVIAAIPRVAAESAEAPSLMEAAR